jgi:ribosomal protein S18 acetylase RimI-like enzyme
MRRLLLHEASVHALPGRVLRDFGDCFLLHDPDEPEPFWNRMESVDWPDDPVAFDRRLAEIGVLFASIGRQPHIWGSPPFDRPVDLIERLKANGFEDVGPGYLMWTRDVSEGRAVLARLDASAAPIRIERLEPAEGEDDETVAERAAPIVTVLLEAFGVEPDRRAGITRETMASLRDPRFTHYLARLDGEPAAVARRATFDGLSYLSSIGTLESARGHGLGRAVTAAAMVDGAEAGSEIVHLGVFADNAVAIRLYEGLGFTFHGDPGPDMVLIA